MKEKWEYYTEKFSTKQGLVDFFFGTAVWGFLIVEYKDAIFDYLFALFDVGSPHVQLYLSYLAFGVALTIVGMIVSTAIITVYEKVFK